MKFVVLFALATCALSAKLPGGGPEVRVLEEFQDGPVAAEYNYRYALDNGVNMEESGSAGSAGQANAQGSFRFISPEGEEIEVRYTADEFGFHAESNALPQDHPLPAHVPELLAIAERQEREGIHFDERGFQI